MNVLIVDDKAHEQQIEALNEQLTIAPNVHVVAKEPQDVDQSDLHDADIVVVDYVLNQIGSTWHASQSRYPFNRQPLDGLAYIAMLRSHIKSPDEATDDLLKAFVLHTGRLDVLANGAQGIGHRLHVLARLNDLDWVFEKNDQTAEEKARGIVAIGQAIRQASDLARTDPDNRGIRFRDLLGLDGSQTDVSGDDYEDWRAAAYKQVQDALPPIHEYAEESAGIAALRWILHRVLPHDCFLLSPAGIAARYGFDPHWLTGQLSTNLAAAFKEARYAGILADFEKVGRYWRVGFDVVLQKNGADTYDRDSVRATVRGLCGEDPVMVGMERPARYLTRELVYADDFVDSGSAARVLPDDWPPFADIPFARQKDLEGNSKLRAIRFQAR